jgi:GTPase
MVAEEDARPGTRAGYVALVGRPNVGKSTLLNHLVGEKLSIVTPRAQTTRDQVLGILTDDSAQIIFVDTPGLLEPSYLLQRSMQETALAAVRDADLVLLLLDATTPAERPEGEALAQLQRRRDVLLVAVNKVDAGREPAVEAHGAWSEEELDVRPLRLSAATGEGVAALRASLVERLPESPFLYPPDEIATQPVRFFVAELIRETIFEEYQQEVPYSTVVRVEEYREAEDPIMIRATIFVERASQKAILIGRGGAGIKRLGQRARAKVEAFVDARVYLDLWVKPMPKWRNKAASLRYLGYPVPDPDRR